MGAAQAVVWDQSVRDTQKLQRVCVSEILYHVLVFFACARENRLKRLQRVLHVKEGTVVTLVRKMLRPTPV
jgi:DNA-binding MarR family transcriptional regulator